MDNNTKANKATATAHRWRYRGNEGDGYQSEGKTGIPPQIMSCRYEIPSAQQPHPPVWYLDHVPVGMSKKSSHKGATELSKHCTLQEPLTYKIQNPE